MPSPVLPRVLTVEPDVHPRAWVDTHRDRLGSELRRAGALLFRGLPVESAEDFEAFVVSVAGRTIEYAERSSPRQQVAGNVYTSTEYPPMYAIFPHNENSYANRWPEFLFFCCQQPPTNGGETPLVPMRDVTSALGPAVRRRFEDRGVMYVRTFREDMGLPWQVAFGTTQRSEVDAYCRAAEIEAEWLGPDLLRTRQTRPAFRLHRHTGDLLWFNHAVAFHVSTLEPAVRRAVESMYDEDALPTNTYYGDGGRIEPGVLDELRDLIRGHECAFPWRRGDVLMVDNMLVAHGRAAFTGPRKILVAMSGLLDGSTTGAGER